VTGRRVVLGKFNDGVTYGLRVSHAGVDALTGDSSGEGFAFDSSWSDIAKLHVVGIATEVVVAGPFYVIQGTIPDLGYKPFAEFRKLESNVVRDDYWISTAPSGGYHNFYSNTQFACGFSNLSPTGNAALYVVYRIPVPSG
jgi:hypothetical protein